MKPKALKRRKQNAVPQYHLPHRFAIAFFVILLVDCLDERVLMELYYRNLLFLVFYFTTPSL
jgi:hypothetical protein